MRFSNLADRLAAKRNRLYTEYEKAAASGKTILDLISANLAEQGWVYPQEQLQAILADAAPRARVYRPDPLGLPSAREAIADYYRTAGIPASAEQVLITPGTSLSYFYCFKLLADPGEEILCPRPSYPLFESIAELAGLRLRYYRLQESRGWEIDLDHLESQISTRTRALVLISPHNPTGMVARGQFLEALAAVACRHDLPVLADEVFSEFLYDLEALPRPAATSAPLVFTLNGFSKMVGLPGLKLGWILLSGRQSRVRKSLEVMELISDTFLPVNDLAQHMAGGIFEGREAFASACRPWLQRCRHIAGALLAACPGVRFTLPRGGFHLTLKVGGAEVDEEALCIDLLRESGVLVHPGYFYDMPPAHLVLTFALRHELLGRSLKALCEGIREWRKRQDS